MVNHRKPWMGDIVTGMERSGKTFYTEQISKAFNINDARISIAYNYGRDSDFSTFEPIKILTSEETEDLIFNTKGKKAEKTYKRRRRIIYFAYKGKVFHFKDFNKVLKGKRVKIRKLFNRQDERNLFLSFFQYVPNCHIIGDDFRSATRYGLPDSFLQLFSSKAHTGQMCSDAKQKGLGTHVSLLYHSLDAVNPELFTYATHISIFPSESPPSVRFLKDNKWLYDNIKKSYQRVLQVRKSPNNYDFVQIDIRNKSVNLIEGERVKNLVK